MFGIDITMNNRVWKSANRSDGIVTYSEGGASILAIHVHRNENPPNVECTQKKKKKITTRGSDQEIKTDSNREGG